MNKYTLLVASLFVSASAFAQWIKPAAPASTPMVVGEETYLYNKGADGFLVGANDYGTRASISNTLGHKVVFEDGAAEGSYYITNYVLSGGMANQMGYMFIEPDNIASIYVDNTKDGKKNNQYTIVKDGDTFKIGLSDANENHKASEYPDAYLGINTTKKDTRLYFCDPENPEGYTMDQCYVDWYCVSPANYEAYISAIKQYDAAVKLGETIEQAKALNVDATAALAVYSNTSSTPEELDAARVALEKDVKNANLLAATVENPYTVASFDFEDKNSSAWTSTTNANNRGADNGNAAADYSVTGIHYENWHPSNFAADSKIYATATAVPAGVYHLSALAYSSNGKGVSLFAGVNSTPVASEKIDANAPAEVYTFLTETTDLEYGLLVEGNTTNWVGIDNVKLEYLGASKEAYMIVADLAIANAPEYTEDTPSQKSFLTAYLDAKATLQAAEEPAEIAAALAAFDAASKALAPSAEAYAAYTAKADEANTWLNSATGSNEDINILADYLESEEEPSTGDYNSNGGFQYIINNGLLDATQIAAETEYLNKILLAAMAANMTDGDDCTELLQNPNFTEQGGWTAAQGIEWPLGNESFRVFQAWGRVCDVNQQLTGLQNGIYELNLQAVYRPDNDADVRQTYAYINDFETKIPVTTEETPANSSEEASTLFEAGTFPVKVYGLVTDGTMKVGIANRLRTGENGILWAGGVSLTFRATNADACASMTAVLAEQANALKDNICGAAEMNALTEAIAATEHPSSANAAYNALKALKEAIDAVNEGTETYANLKVAIDGLAEAIQNNKTADAATIEAAQSVLDAASAAYETKLYNTAEAEQAVSDVNAATVSIKMGSGSATEDEPVDYTDAIINNTFDPAKGDKNEKRIDGWKVEGALNGYKSNSCSFNKGTFNLSQDLSGLPKGKYKVTVHTYYRAGSYEEEEANINAGKDTHLMKLYANTSEDQYVADIMNLSEGSKDVTLPADISTRTINGITVPDGTGASVKCYEAGLFLNELTFFVGEDGKATIGLRLDETIGTNDYTVVGKWNLTYMGDVADATEQDVTTLIVNNTFDPAKGDKNEKRIDGWKVEGALNGYKKNTASFNKGTFDLSQSLSGLPEGTYKVTVHTFYRAGSYEEEEANINAGKDTHLCNLYAIAADKSYAKPVVNLSEGANGITIPEGVNTKTINGITVPDGTDASVACFNAGYYLNELPFYVDADGKATIGLRLDETIGTNDYVVVGEWNLYYYGSGNKVDEITGIEGIVSTDAVSAGFYSISGAKLSAPQKGINIVKMANGKSIKIFVK